MMTSLHGTFHLPDATDQTREGTLHIDGQRATLSLTGNFHGERQVATDRITEPIIYGTTTEGPVTLLGAYHDLRIPFAQEYFTTHTVLGLHLQPDTLLDAVTITTSQSDNFLQARAGIRTGPPREPQTARFLDRDIVFAVERSDEEALADDQPRSTITLRATTWPEAWRAIGALNLLVTIAAGRPDAIISINAQAGTASARLLSAIRDTATERAPDRRAAAMICTIDDLPDVSNALANADQLKNTLAHVLDPYLAYLRDPRDITPATVHIGRALESYHRDAQTNHTQHAIPSDDFQKIGKLFRTIMSICFSSHAKWTQNALQNFKSFADRLRDLYDDEQALMDDIAEREAFAKTVKNNRNAVAHGNDLLRKQAITDVFWSNERARFLYTALLLQRLGFTKVQAHDLLRRNAAYDLLVTKHRTP